jgi:hypothetical protein
VDVYEYFHSRERECRELSLAPDVPFEDMFAEEEGSEGQRGLVFGRLVLSETAYLSVFEKVVVTGSGVHRERYSYYLIVNGMEMWGYDRDPSHQPEEHMHHGCSHAREAAGRVTFKEVAERAWETVTQEADLTPESFDF